MQRLCTLLFCCTVCFSLSLSAQDAKNVYENMFCPIDIYDEYIMLGEWENIDEQEAIVGAIAYMTFYRSDSTIAYQMSKQVGTIEPGESVFVEIGYIDWLQVQDALDIAWSEMKLESENDVNLGNNGVLKACSILPDPNGFSVEDIREAIESVLEGRNEYGLARAYLLPAPTYPGRQVSSYGDPELSFQTTQRGWLGWIQWNPYLEFPAPTTLFEVDVETLEVTEYESFWWPVIDGDDQRWIGNSGLFIDGSISPDQEISEVPGITPAEPTDNDSVCAIIVNGRTAIGGLGPNNTSHDMFAWTLTKNPFGPRLNETQIYKRHTPNPDSVLARVTATKGNCTKLHFFFSGVMNSSKDTSGNWFCDLLVGDTEDENDGVLPARDLLQAMLDSEVKNICITIDASWSGRITEMIKKDARFNDRNVEVLTSTDTQKFAQRKLMTVGTQEQTSGLFTWHYMQCSADSLADTNEDGVISRREIFEWIKYNDPATSNGARLSEETGFSLFSRGALQQASGNERVNIVDKNSGVSVYGTPGQDTDMLVQSSVTYEAAKDPSFEPNGQLANMFSERTWEISIDGSQNDVWINIAIEKVFEDLFIANIYFWPGLVYFDTLSSQWVALHSQEYTSGAKDAWAYDLENGKYKVRIALLVIHDDVPEPVEPILSYPNPSSSSVSFVALRSGESLVNIYGASGALIRSSTMNLVEDEYTTMDVSTLTDGVYFVLVQTDERIGAFSFTKQ